MERRANHSRWSLIPCLFTTTVLLGGCRSSASDSEDQYPRAGVSFVVQEPAKSAELIKDIEVVLRLWGFTVTDRSAETLECWKRMDASGPTPVEEADSTRSAKEDLLTLYSNIRMFEVLGPSNGPRLYLRIKAAKQASGVMLSCNAEFR